MMYNLTRQNYQNNENTAPDRANSGSRGAKSYIISLIIKIKLLNLSSFID